MVPAALVQGDEPRIPALGSPDADDRHIPPAAVEAEVIVTPSRAGFSDAAGPTPRGVLADPGSEESAVRFAVGQADPTIYVHHQEGVRNPPANHGRTPARSRAEHRPSS